MAEIRISAKDLSNIDQFQRRLNGMARTLDARAVEAMSGAVIDKINAGVGKLLANVDALAARVGITDPESARSLKQGLEAVEGGTFVGKEIAPFLPLLGVSPHARLAALGIGVLGGAIEGAAREAGRKAAAQARQLEADLAYLRQQEIDAIQDEIRRREAARKAARGVR